MSGFQFNFPATNPRINSSRKYWDDVISKFPCPAGYEEIQYGFRGKVFCRDDLTCECYISPVNNINHDIGMCDVIERMGDKDVEYGCLAVWYVRFIGE